MLDNKRWTQFVEEQYFQVSDFDLAFCIRCIEVEDEHRFEVLFTDIDSETYFHPGIIELDDFFITGVAEENVEWLGDTIKFSIKHVEVKVEDHTFVIVEPKHIDSVSYNFRRGKFENIKEFETFTRALRGITNTRREAYIEYKHPTRINESLQQHLINSGIGFDGINSVLIAFNDNSANHHPSTIMLDIMFRLRHK